MSTTELESIWLAPAAGEPMFSPGQADEALRNCGGIRAEVIESGLIQPGNAIIPVGERTQLP